MADISSKVITTFPMNNKTYLLLEIDNIEQEDFQTESFIERSILPAWEKFKIDAKFGDGKVCIVISYGNKKWEQCITVLSECYTPGDIDIFSVGPAKVYLRYCSICPAENGAKISMQVWAKAGSLKTKLGEFTQQIP